MTESSYELAKSQEVEGFKHRKKYLRSQKGVNALKKLRKQIEDQETRLMQRSLFVEEDDARERQLREIRWQLDEHEKRIDSMLDYVQREERRMLEHIIPKRYSLAHFDLQPVAVKIILGKSHE